MKHDEIAIALNELVNGYMECVEIKNLPLSRDMIKGALLSFVAYNADKKSCLTCVYSRPNEFEESLVKDRLNMMYRSCMFGLTEKMCNMHKIIEE